MQEVMFYISVVVYLKLMLTLSSQRLFGFFPCRSRRERRPRVEGEEGYDPYDFDSEGAEEVDGM